MGLSQVELLPVYVSPPSSLGERHLSEGGQCTECRTPKAGDCVGDFHACLSTDTAGRVVLLQVVFSLLLLTDTLYSPLPAGLGQGGRRPRTAVAVEVQDHMTRARHHWTLAKLRCWCSGSAYCAYSSSVRLFEWESLAFDCCRQRLCLMRDMYDHAADVPKDRDCDRGTRAGDPFSDPPPHFHLIGR